MIARPPVARTAALTSAALVAFAANSLLCRAALRGGDIDPASFTVVRLGSGALLLALIAALSGRGERLRRPGRLWAAAFLLFAYAIAFSLAYTALTAGSGALILFGAVQSTMLLAGLARGERLRARAALGLILALGGLAWLVLPGWESPPLSSAVLMALAGVAWGAYSLLGRDGADPLSATTHNFIFALPFAAAAFIAGIVPTHSDARGIALAAASGALASGLGYVAWYAALRGLAATTAALVQLAVPVLAALAGVALLGEPLTLRLATSAGAILGGIGLALARKPERSGSRGEG